MKQEKPLPQQNLTEEEQWEELLRRQQENIILYPVKPEIPDNPSRGWDHEKTVLPNVIPEFRAINRARHAWRTLISMV